SENRVVRIPGRIECEPGHDGEVKCDPDQDASGWHDHSHPRCGPYPEWQYSANQHCPFQRKRAVMLVVQKTGTASTLDVVHGIKDLIPPLKTTLPPALNILPLADQSIFVTGAIDGVVRETVIAACLTAIMVLLFLGDWKSTLIIAISIPLAILSSIAALSALGQTLNIMTLGGLALAVGILVDDATVTIENIDRHLAEG